MRYFKPSDSIKSGIGKGTTHVSKHLAFKQRRRNSTQIDLYKRLFCAQTILMNGFGNQFFTRPTFARNQHRRVGCRNSANGF